MAFAPGLRESLTIRQSLFRAEFTNGAELEQVLTRDLLAVEAMAKGELITSILLLSADGKRLAHGAAPGLPEAYCAAIDGSEIGPCAGSCGTAAFFGRPVYVSDIATDPLWAGYRDLALFHGLRSCWSTPIREADGTIIGTFAIYRRSVGNPSHDEIEAIDMITDHVASAIVLARGVRDQRPPRRAPQLRLVVTDQPSTDRLLGLVTQLQHKAAELDRVADCPRSQEVAETLRTTAHLSRKLVKLVRRQIDHGSKEPR